MAPPFLSEIEKIKLLIVVNLSDGLAGLEVSKIKQAVGEVVVGRKKPAVSSPPLTEPGKLP